MFKFKGISSKDMQVVIEEEEHFIARAARRYETTEIEGRDGAIFEELGYSYVERPIYVQCLNTDKIDDILAWLDGEGEFEYKDRKTTARFYSQLEPQREGYIRIIDTTFIRDPFWTKLDDEYVEVKERKDKTTEKSDCIHVEDSSNNVAKINVFGVSKQETREGYNLLNVASEFEVTLRSKAIPISLKPNTDYTIKVDNIETTNENPTTLAISFRNESDTSVRDVAFPYTGRKTTFQVTGEATKVYIYSSNSYNDSQGITTTYKNLMIYEGTEDKEYEKYGETPSPEIPSEIENVTGDIDITVCNKNFLNVNSECKVAGSKTVAIKMPTGNYTIKADDITTDSEQTQFCFSFRDSSGTIADARISLSTKKITFALTREATSVVIYSGNSFNESQGVTTTYKNLMIYKETGDEQYTEHEQQLITFPLSEGQKLHDKDYLASDGIHHVRKQVELNGTEGWGLSTLNSYQWFRRSENGVKKSSVLICNYFKNYKNIGNYIGVSNNDTADRIYLAVSEEITTVKQLKAWLAEKKTEGTPVIVEYELAEEEIEPYTPAQQEAYNQLQNVLSYYNVTNVFTDKAQLVFKYIADTTEKITNEGNVYSRPILRLEKTIYNEVDIMIEDSRFQYDFNDEEYVEIDCEEKEVKYEGLNRNRKMQIGYEFPKLKAGENEIKMYEGDCIIKAKRKDRWL